ncbi:Crp/Fnr family transcriptional regulator [Rhizorhabdus dicambivorans]|uniref:Crp/Fnr family transcriptional regulator n=1 Tax=Rhizorhabdus dicambivorans TaxID=1850238 RepID=A0A2A4FTF3_9SPHN|nr:Crp/Fnr family transcriptional regulator [Rhizorhabdus dicambivorans]ATE63516.1 Crp/Fnr family transcriptional regulator [Rhizorhabdus dicambivorans]PCE41429.1 Crp/Fnr family transcriptional regulator [Rhizorhabdus dicambivorans]
MEAIDICADCGVRDRALCGSLSDAELATLNRLGRRRHVARDETIAWAGDDNIVCANLLSGVLKLSAAATDGREQTVGLLYPADFVGTPFAEQVDFTITALTDAELCVFPREPFERVLGDHAAMERLLLQRVLAALGEARGRMFSLARGSAGEKVAGFLLDMARRAATSGCRATPQGPLTFDLPLSRGETAAVLGLTIETASRQIRKLERDQIIALPGGRAVTILDMAALEARAQA